MWGGKGCRALSDESRVEIQKHKLFRSAEFIFDNVFINPIIKGNHKCIYYSIGNVNGLEDQEILSQNTLLDYGEHYKCKGVLNI